VDRVPRIKQLHRELNEIQVELAACVQPTSAGRPPEWTLEQAERHADLLKRFGAIMEKLTKLESGLS
jgi:hypothetical protein